LPILASPPDSKPPLLEYWKPPKPVIHHTRSSPSQSPSPIMSGNNYYNNMENLQTVFPKTSAAHGGQGPPPAYTFDASDEPSRAWWNPTTWGKKTKILVAVGIAAVIAIIVAVAVVVTKKNKYPDYSKLTYSMVTTCKHFLPQMRRKLKNKINI
jgi:hypothetical protein